MDAFLSNSAVPGLLSIPGKITMKHGPIKKLDMDLMTMVFRVADPAMLDAVKAGDTLRFAVTESTAQSRS